MVFIGNFVSYNKSDDYKIITFTLSKRLELNKVHRSGITHTSQHRPNYLDLLNLESNIEFLLD